MQNRLNKKGMSLLEVVMAFLILSILASTSVYFAGDFIKTIRYEETRAKMEAIKKAIIGDDARDSAGRRVNFGFHGDYGSVPASFLILTGEIAGDVWVYNATYGFGAGYRGPYIGSQYSTGYGITKDAFGTNFVWTPGASPPTLVSYGADAAVGGTGFATDLTYTFPTSERMATVYGFVLDGDKPFQSKTVQVRYPLTNTITFASTTTDANGAFSFSNIPFGPRAFTVTDTPTQIGPIVYMVDSPITKLPNTLLNSAGMLQKLTYSSVAMSRDGSRATVTYTSGYDASQTLQNFTCFISGTTGAYVKVISLNGNEGTVSGCIGNGSTYSGSYTGATPTSGLASGGSLSFYLDFRQSDCTTPRSLLATSVVTCKLEWTSGNEDSITFTVPTYTPWTQITTTGAPSLSIRKGGVWTGSKLMIFAGGDGASANYKNDGGLYDPITDSWTSTNTTTAPCRRQNPNLVMTKTKVFVYGGYSDNGAGNCSYNAQRNDGYLYDPLGDTWTALSTTGAPPGGDINTNRLWTGSKVLVWGQMWGSGNVGAQYDIDTNSWAAMTTTGAPSPRWCNKMSVDNGIWTGTHMIIWGGLNGATDYNTGAKYLPDYNCTTGPCGTWTAMTTTGAPAPRSIPYTAWSGTKMIVFGGYDDVALGSNVLGNKAWLYDPLADSWTSSTTTGAPIPRWYGSAVWTGSKFLVYGGYNETAGTVNTGALYDPTANTWTATSTTGAMSLGYYAYGASAWTGNVYMFFGSSAAPFNSGYRYVPPY